MTRDRLVHAVAATIAVLPQAMVVFGVLSEAQAAAIGAVVAAFVAGYRTERISAPPAPGAP